MLGQMNLLNPGLVGIQDGAVPGAGLSDSQFAAQNGINGAWNDLASKTAVKVAHEKVNRLMKQMKQSLDDVRLAIQMSSDKIQDRAVEENAVKKVAQTEIEVSQTLALIPYSKDMNEYKVNQLNEIAMERRELEKILLEQRLANRGGGMGKTDKEYKERQARIKEELRRAMGEVEEVSGAYSPKIGFDLHFDYVLDIPEMHQSAQVIYGVYKQGIAMIKSL